MVVEDIYQEAMSAAQLASDNCIPNPIRLRNMDGSSEILEDGVCGFAWVNIKPARGPFVAFLKKNNIGYRDSYYGGWTVSMHMGDQSMQRKEAAGLAFANVLKNYGIDCCMNSRMD